jgi:hypothetical protein
MVFHKLLAERLMFSTISTNLFDSLKNITPFG